MAFSAEPVFFFIFLCHVFRSYGTVPLDYVAKRQLRQDLQLGTEADYAIVLTRAEKLHPGVYTFLQGDPRQNVARVQALFESLWYFLRKCAWKHLGSQDEKMKTEDKIRKFSKKRDDDEDTIQPRFHGSLERGCAFEQLFAQLFAKTASVLSYKRS